MWYRNIPQIFCCPIYK